MHRTPSSLRRCVAQFVCLCICSRVLIAELQTEFLWLHAGNGCAQFTSISAINSALNAPNGRTNVCISARQIFVDYCSAKHSRLQMFARKSTELHIFQSGSAILIHTPRSSFSCNRLCFCIQRQIHFIINWLSLFYCAIITLFIKT